MNNLELYNKLKTPPKDALKPIKAGRLKGKSDISPQWRIEAMTNQFGICGIGWRYEITSQWTEHGSDNQVFAFTNVNLFIKVDNEWSEAIPSTGGSLLVVSEKNGMYCNDEAFKMSLTDALGNSMKYLGMAADVYSGNMDNDGENTKHDTPEQSTNNKPWLNLNTPEWNETVTKMQTKGVKLETVKEHFNISNKNQGLLQTYEK